MIKRTSLLFIILSFLQICIFFIACGPPDRINEDITQDEYYDNGDCDSEQFPFQVQFADPSYLNYACGYFNENQSPLSKEYGEPLVENVDYKFDYPLNSGSYNIYDNTTSYCFDYGKYIKIVENGKNITNLTGLALTPIAKDLSLIISPPNNQCFIDPEIGMFILPMPDFWSRCESINNWYNPEISFSENSPSLSALDGLSSDTGKFSYSIKLSAPYRVRHGQRDVILYPFYGDGYGFDKGTISVWVYLLCDIEEETFAGSRLNLINDNSGTNSLYVKLDGHLGYFDSYSASLYYGNSNESSFDISSLMYSWFHCYIVWDLSGELTEGKTCRVFLNGVERLSSTNAFPSQLTQIFNLKMYARCESHEFWDHGYVKIDNLKIWKHVVSESPDWIYNNGLGIEEAIHSIYSPENGYKPVLKDVGNGVSYYYTP